MSGRDLEILSATRACREVLPFSMSSSELHYVIIMGLLLLHKHEGAVLPALLKVLDELYPAIVISADVTEWLVSVASALSTLDLTLCEVFSVISEDRPVTLPTASETAFTQS